MKQKKIENIFVMLSDFDTFIIFRTYLKQINVKGHVVHLFTAWELSPFSDFDATKVQVTLFVEFNRMKNLSKILENFGAPPFIVTLPQNAS